MSNEWLAHRERGSDVALQLITWFTTALGYRAGRLALYPICGYFLIFSLKARVASRDYLRRAMQRSPSLADVFKHYHMFATTLLDRIDILGNRLDVFKIRYHGLAEFQRIVETGRGCLLIGAHLGSFELLRALASRDRSIVVNTVMFEDNATRIGRWMRAQNTNAAVNIIPAGRADTLLRVSECLERGEWVAMLADRPITLERTLACEFLGTPALFPSGPMLSAALLKAPVALFFGLCDGPRSYDIYLETVDTQQTTFDRQHRETALRDLSERYVKRLEYHVRQAPYNWFNFYDFWRLQ